MKKQWAKPGELPSPRATKLSDHRSHQPPVLFFFLFIVVWAHYTLVGIRYHFSETTGVVYLFSVPGATHQKNQPRLTKAPPVENIRSGSGCGEITSG